MPRQGQNTRGTFEMRSKPRSYTNEFLSSSLASHALTLVTSNVGEGWGWIRERWPVAAPHTDKSIRHPKHGAARRGAESTPSGNRDLDLAAGSFPRGSCSVNEATTQCPLGDPADCQGGVATRVDSSLLPWSVFTSRDLQGVKASQLHPGQIFSRDKCQDWTVARVLKHKQGLNLA